MAAKLVSLSIAVSVVLTVSAANMRPYRLSAPIAQQTHDVTTWDDGVALRVDESTATYVQALKAMAGNGNWRSGTPLIDLTGATPAAALVLGGRFFGIPWIPGGYPGSQKLASRVLRDAKRIDLESAWILTAPQGIRRISSAVLGDAGLVFPDAYERLGAVRTGYRDETQFLWKPRAGLEKEHFRERSGEPFADENQVDK